MVCLNGRYRDDQCSTFPSFLLCIIHAEDVPVNVKKAYRTFCRSLTMSVISGSLGQLIALRGRLPEDLSLHYQLQVLTALEYLAKKKVVHLDIKGMLHKVQFYVISLYLQQLTPYLNVTSVGLKSNQERILKLIHTSLSHKKKRLTRFERYNKRPTVSRLQKTY